MGNYGENKLENYLELLANDLKNLWKGINNLQRAFILLLTVAAIMSISFIIMKSIEPQWGVLYSDLKETDAA
ncbi:MAG: hypothetical protein KAQ92_06360, partial [Candidatus Aenigmarchaeota archaeon]|nr:hypothetical protein [Candidatus Aenigmarchaeota archaeon]